MAEVLAWLELPPAEVRIRSASPRGAGLGRQLGGHRRTPRRRAGGPRVARSRRLSPSPPWRAISRPGSWGCRPACRTISPLCSAARSRSCRRRAGRGSSPSRRPRRARRVVGRVYTGVSHFSAGANWGDRPPPTRRRRRRSPRVSSGSPSPPSRWRPRCGPGISPRCGELLSREWEARRGLASRHLDPGGRAAPRDRTRGRSLGWQGVRRGRGRLRRAARAAGRGWHGCARRARWRAAGCFRPVPRCGASNSTVARSAEARALRPAGVGPRERRSAPRAWAPGDSAKRRNAPPTGGRQRHGAGESREGSARSVAVETLADQGRRVPEAHPLQGKLLPGAPRPGFVLDEADGVVFSAGPGDRRGQGILREHGEGRIGEAARDRPRVDLADGEEVGREVVTARIGRLEEGRDRPATAGCESGDRRRFQQIDDVAAGPVAELGSRLAGGCLQDK